ncbi:MAG: YqaE/Pmp3 family membrane protein [Sumerlaeia bacterium]
MSKPILAIIAFFLPPLAVFLRSGINADFWINLVLTIIGFWILGFLHALYLIFGK